MHAYLAISLPADTTSTTATPLANLAHLQASVSMLFTLYADAGHLFSAGAGDPASSIARGPTVTAIYAVYANASDPLLTDDANAGNPASSIARGPTVAVIFTSLPSTTDSTAYWKTSDILEKVAL
jgi:hypothetical protein